MPGENKELSCDRRERNIFDFLVNYALAVYTHAGESFNRGYVNIGVGMNIMWRYRLNERLFLSVGSMRTFDFLSYDISSSKLLSNKLKEPRVRDFFMTGYRVYTSLGFKL